MKVKIALLCASIALTATIPVNAQVALGTPWMGSFAGGPDVVDLGNLNVEWTFPLINKPGRGIPFVLAPTLDSSIWYPVTSGSTNAWQPNTTWGWGGLPSGYNGYVTDSYPSPTPEICGPPVNGNSYYYEFFIQYIENFVYVDAKGTPHPVSLSPLAYYYAGPEGCEGTVPSNPTDYTESGSATDGSGYSLSVTQNGEYLTYSVTMPNGHAFNLWQSPGLSGQTEDINGNYISCSSSSCTDTLNTTVMSVAGGPTNSPMTITGPGSTTYEVNYSELTIQTKFGCSGISEYGPTQQYLPTSIQLPDGREYKIAYEKTPGSSSNYTGRIASITLPTDTTGNPTITYSYSGGGSGVNGIECSDGSTPTLTRTTPDGQWTYSRSYSSPVWITTITDPLNEETNVALNAVTSTSGPTEFYEVGRQIYNSSSTLLETILTCYQVPANVSSCPTTYSATIANGGVTTDEGSDKIVTTQFPSNSGISSGYSIQYLNGLPAIEMVYDFGAAGTGQFSSNPLQIHGTFYSSIAGVFDSDTGITFGTTYRIYQDYVVNGYATPWAPLIFTQYNYSQSGAVTSGAPQHSTAECSSSACNSLGNLVSVYKWLSGGDPITQNGGISSCTAPACQTITYTNFDTGLVDTATDVNGGETAYSYSGSGGCADAFPVSIQLTTGNSSVPTLTTSGTWNCNLGKPATSVDPSGNTTTYGYTTSYGYDEFGRPTSITNNVTGAVMDFTYPSSSAATTTESAMTFNSSSSTQTSIVTSDRLGRPIDQQTLQGPGTGAGYDTVSTTYDTLGRASFVTLACTTTSQGASCPGSGSGPGTTTAYDALNRTTQATDGGGGYVSYTYQPSSNDVLVAVGPQTTTPSSENLKKRQLQYNGAGWLASVCEITSTLTGNGSCGQTTSGTGFLTQYTYDSAGRLTETQQNAQPGSSGVQTRTVSYDALNRKTSETIPEWSAGTSSAGTTSYTYDSDSSGTCSGTYSGDLIKSVDAAGDATCYTYDLQHRQLSSKVVSGTYADPTTPQTHFVYDAATYSGNSMQNALGYLAEAYTCTGSCTSKLTDVFVSTSAISTGQFAGGASVENWESTPNSGGYFLTTDTYYPNGALGNRTVTLAGNSIGFPNVTYGLDGEGRPYSATDSSRSITPVTAVTYNPASLATQLTYGNSSTGSSSDVDTFQYDSHTYRPTGLKYTINATAGSFYVNTALTWNSNGTLQQMVYTDTQAPAKDQTCTYTADDLTRIASVNCGASTWEQNFTYDPLGNITKSGSLSYAAGYSPATNQVNSGITPLPTYDANGNQLKSTGLSSISWDAYAQPVSVTPQSGGAISGVYDALGRLVENDSGTTYTQFVFSPAGQKIAVVQSGTLAKGFIPLPGGATAIYSGTSGMPYMRHLDWLGSARYSTTWSHAVQSKVAYAPFGETYNEAQSSSGDRSFTGQDQSTVTSSGGQGIYDFMFRKYDPSAGRWLSPDPSGWEAVNPAAPQSLDRYTYLDDYPLNSVDLDGLCPYWSVYTSNFNGEGTTVSGSWVDDGTPCMLLSAGVSEGALPPGWSPYGTINQGPGADPNGGNSPVCSSGGDPGLSPASISVVAGAEATIGPWPATASKQPTAGWWQSLSSYTNFGTFTSNTTYTSNAVGAYAGAGVGLMASNANNVSQLQLTNTTRTLSLPVASFSLSTGGGIWEFQVTIGPGLIAAYSKTSSSTNITSNNNPCP